MHRKYVKWDTSIFWDGFNFVQESPKDEKALFLLYREVFQHLFVMRRIISPIKSRRPTLTSLVF